MNISNLRELKSSQQFCPVRTPRHNRTSTESIFECERMCIPNSHVARIVVIVIRRSNPLAVGTPLDHDRESVSIEVFNDFPTGSLPDSRAYPFSSTASQQCPLWIPGDRPAIIALKSHDGITRRGIPNGNMITAGNGKTLAIGVPGQPGRCIGIQKSTVYFSRLHIPQ